MNKKIWTGERLETHISNETMIEHLHRYAIALEFVKNKIVLDIASGEGYGSNLLANSATKVFGVDIDEETIQKAIEKYKKHNLVFQVGTASEIPIADHSIDVVISFETLEHHDQHEKMLHEIKRILKPDGILIMSSPDKKFYSDEPGYNNPFHIKELYQKEFKELINRHFTNATYLNQRYTIGSLIKAEKESDQIEFYSGDYKQLNTTLFTPVYNIVIASDKQLKNLQSSFFITNNLLSSLHSDIENVYLNSTTWKIGHLILKPFKFFKDIMKIRL